MSRVFLDVFLPTTMATNDDSSYLLLFLIFSSDIKTVVVVKNDLLANKSSFCFYKL